VPIGLRFFLSAIPLFMLYKVVIAQEPVHAGRGGPIMPRLAGWLSVIGVCAPFLYLVWQGVKLTDFHFRRDRRISLFGNPDASTHRRNSSDPPSL
jgi:hypothetical protein